MSNENFYWLNEHSRQYLSRGYIPEGMTGEERVREIADHAEKLLGKEGFSDKFFDYMAKGYYSLSSPVWSNFGNDKGLPVSCFGSYIDDNIGSILHTHGEVGTMSKFGGGCSGYFGELRPRGSSIGENGKTFGSVHFIELFQTLTSVVSQGCYDDQTEILTNHGWMLFSDLMENRDVKVAQVTDDDRVEFVEPQDYFRYDVDEDLILFKDSRNIDLLVTKNHNMAFKYDKKTIEYDEDGNKQYKREVKPEYRLKRADETPTHRDVKFCHSSFLESGDEMTDFERILVALQSDGSIVQRCKDAATFRFSKDRKKERLEELLNRCGIEYTYSFYEKDRTHNFYVNFGRNLPKRFEDWVDIENIGYEWAESFIWECSHWDGSINVPEVSFSFTSTHKSDVDIIQSIASVCGFKSSIKYKNREDEPNKKPIYVIFLSKGQCFGVENIEKELVPYKGYVYCVEVPTNKIIVRRNGKTVVCGNSVRRGFFSPYQDIEHEDAMEFIDIASEGHPIQHLTHGVCVGDQFLNDMIGGNPEGRTRWARLIQRRGENGFPYIFFRDNVNNNTVDVYKDKGMKIHASNMCMVGSDRVVTDKGYLKAEDLYHSGEELTLFDGEKKVDATEMKLREKDAPVYKITLSNGLEHTVTDYHGIPVLDDRGNINRVELKDLKIGDKVAIQTEKGLFGDTDMKDEAFLLGLYQSDGTQTKDKQNIYLDVWENDFDIIDEVQEKFNKIHTNYGCDTYTIKTQNGYAARGRKAPQFYECSPSNGTVAKKRLGSRTLKKALDFEKGSIPEWIWTGNEETQWEYIRGLLIADGTAGDYGQPMQVAYADIDLNFLKELQLMFNNLGLTSSIRLLRKAGKQLLPDGKGGEKLYETKDCYRLIVTSRKSILEIEKNTGFLTRKGVNIEDREYRDNRKKRAEVVSIEYVGKEDVYCPTVKNDEHVFVAQGMKTFNCSEINLPSSSDESFVCVLSSMNVLHYDEWKHTDAVETLAYFLDAVVEEFLQKIEKMRDSSSREQRQAFIFMERAYNFAKRHRALGIGILGWHSYLQSNMIAFESSEARSINEQMMKTINEKSWAASKEMADVYGEPDILKGYGRRNTTLTAIAPTKSSSFILGQVSQSIEPERSNVYIKDLAKIRMTFKNPYLEKLLESKGKNDIETWENIKKFDGSVQHLDFLSENEKNVFKTFNEINAYSVLDQAADRQKFLDQSQSLNLFVSPSAPTKDINQLYLYAWKQGIKTLYYQYSENAAQSLNQQKNQCSSCEA